MLGLLATTKVLSTSVSPAELGQFMLALTIVSAINQILIGPYQLALGRFHAKTLRTQEALTFKAVAFRLQLKLGLSALSLVLITTLVLRKTSFADEISLLLITGCFGVFTSWNSITALFFDIEQRRIRSAIIKMGEVWLRLILCLLLTSFFSANAVYIALAYCGGALAIALPTLLRSPNVFKNASYVNYVQRKIINNAIWQFASPALIFGIFTWINISSDKWALAYFWGDHATGTYSVLYMVAYTPIVAIAAISSQYFTPLIYKKIDNPNDSHTKNDQNFSSRVIMFVSISAATFSLFQGDRIVLFFATPEYLEYALILPLLFLSSGFFMSAEALLITEIGKYGTRNFISLKISTSILGFFINIVLAKYFGIPGIAVASLTFSIIYFTLTYRKYYI